MSNLYFSLINPVVKTLLRSPLHGIMSHNTLILEFKGRKSGKTYSTPVSYHESNGRVHCFTEKNNKWLYNLRDGAEVELTLRGRKKIGKPSVVADGSVQVQTALNDILIAVPRDASHTGVALDTNGRPIASDVEEASTRVALISIEVQQ